MSEKTPKMAVILSRGIDDERTAVALTIANVGLSEGVEVTLFLVSAGVDVVRKGAADLMRMNPLDPSLGEMLESLQANGGQIWSCPPCTSVRGYEDGDLIEGVEIKGAVALHDLIKSGASTVCF